MHCGFPTFQTHIKYDGRCLGQKKKMDKIQFLLIKSSQYFEEKRDTQMTPEQQQQQQQREQIPQ